MNRPMKFRLTLKGRTIGYLRVTPDEDGLLHETWNTDNEGGWIFGKLPRHDNRDCFTGLTDKNGRDIYENDWIDTKNGSHFVIVWDEENVCFKACGNDTRFKGAWVHPIDGVGPREEWEVSGN